MLVIEKTLSDSQAHIILQRSVVIR